jgi:uncharacterized protein YdaU (DUF1376 family)
MNERVDVFMQLYVGDYLADTTDLTTEEHGAYLLLLMALWKNEGRLPCDPPRLARITKLTPRRWEAVWTVIGRFFDFAEGHFFQGRLLREIENAKARKRRASDSGRKAAVTRWAPHADRIETAVRIDSSSPSPSEPEPEKKKEPENVSLAGNPPARVERKPKAAPEYPEAFDAIWYGTGRIGNKFPALEAWEGMGKPPPEIVLEGWRWAEKHDRRWPGAAGNNGKDCRPHLATWLNARGWEDRPQTGGPPLMPPPREVPTYTGHEPR